VRNPLVLKSRFAAPERARQAARDLAYEVGEAPPRHRHRRRPPGAAASAAPPPARGQSEDRASLRSRVAIAEGDFLESDSPSHDPSPSPRRAAGSSACSEDEEEEEWVPPPAPLSARRRARALTRHEISLARLERELDSARERVEEAAERGDWREAACGEQVCARLERYRRGLLHDARR
jgi:hypothetical protein